MKSAASNRVRQNEAPSISYHSNVIWYSDLQQSLGDDSADRVRRGIKRNIPKRPKYKGSVSDPMETINLVLDYYLSLSDVNAIGQALSHEAMNWTPYKVPVIMALTAWFMANKWDRNGRDSLCQTLQCMLTLRISSERISVEDIEEALDELANVFDLEDDGQQRVDVLRKELRARGLIPINIIIPKWTLYAMLMLVAMVGLVVIFKFCSFPMKYLEM